MSPGLLEQPMPPQQGAPPAPPAEAPPGAGATAVPEEKALLGNQLNQEELDIFVANGLKLVHDPKVSDTLITSITKAQDPVKAIADATLNVVGRLEQSSQQAGKKLSLTTLAYGANYVMGEIITVAEAAGLEKMDDQTKYHAYSLAVAKYLDTAVKTGKMTKEEVVALGKQAEGTPEGKKIMQTAQQTTPEMPTSVPMGGQNAGVA